MAKTPLPPGTTVGLGLVFGAGTGTVLGLAIAGATGIAVGAGIGAGLGLVGGAVIDLLSHPKSDDKPKA